MVKLRSMTKTRQISANQRQAEINHRLHAELPKPYLHMVKLRSRPKHGRLAPTNGKGKSITAYMPSCQK
jgi:hypothetical protein